MDRNFWTAVAIAAVAPFLGLLAAVIKLRREGITAASLEEIKDRATFRQHMMERLDAVETRETALRERYEARLQAVEDRERKLIERYESRERQLLNDIAELNLKIERLEDLLKAAGVDRERIERKIDAGTAESARIEHKFDDAAAEGKSERERIEHKVDENHGRIDRSEEREKQRGKNDAGKT